MNLKVYKIYFLNEAKNKKKVYPIPENKYIIE